MLARKRIGSAASCVGRLLLLVVGLASGCTVGPDFQRPRAPFVGDWSMSANPRMQGQPARLGDWWTHFQDPVLDGLIRDSLAQNFTLREAGERIIEARARRDIAAGNLYPQSQNVAGSFSTTQLSSNTANFFSVLGVFETDVNPENWAMGLGAAWELDFWGKFRRAVESADASLDATCAAYDDARVLLLAEVAQAYIELRTLENRIALARNNLDVQKQTLELASKKKDAGLATGLDIAQAQTNVGQTAAVLPSLEIARRQASHALCVLLGRTPADLSSELGGRGEIPHPPHNLAFGIPADLLRRRPDVRRAEFELAAQSARIGVAKSEFYPHISLIGDIGFQAEDFGKLYSSNSQSGFISPGFSWNLLNYGRIKSNVKAEEAAFRALCAAYQSSVLRAAQEAEDAQVAYVLGFDRADALVHAVRGSTDAVSKAETLYKSGSIDFGRVYVLQAQLLQQQDALAVSQGQISLSLVQLFKALGGGWQKCEPTPPVFVQPQQVPAVPQPVAWSTQSVGSKVPVALTQLSSPPARTQLDAQAMSPPFQQVVWPRLRGY